MHCMQTVMVKPGITDNDAFARLRTQCRPVEAGHGAGSRTVTAAALPRLRMAWIRVQIRFSLGAMIARSSGCRGPPSLRRTSCGRSAAWSPISRKFFAQSASLCGVVRYGGLLQVVQDLDDRAHLGISEEGVGSVRCPALKWLLVEVADIQEAVLGE